jgi:hypothetical protein
LLVSPGLLVCWMNCTMGEVKMQFGPVVLSHRKEIFFEVNLPARIGDRHKVCIRFLEEGLVSVVFSQWQKGFTFHGCALCHLTQHSPLVTVLKSLSYRRLRCSFVRMNCPLADEGPPGLALSNSKGFCSFKFSQRFLLLLDHVRRWCLVSRWSSWTVHHTWACPCPSTCPR